MMEPADRPQWYLDMSPREKATYEMAHERTAEDYLAIIHERPDVHFTEYDNLDVLFQMIKDGLIEWREDKPSKHTSMFTALYPRLTGKGVRP